MTSTGLLAAVGAFIVLLGAYFVLPWLLKPWLVRRLAAQVRRSGRVCLTFDDGPDAASTARLLDVLDREGAKATFFLLGRNVVRNPALVRRMVESGHEIGEHGFGHRHAWKTGPVAYLRDLLESRRALAETGGREHVVLYRPAYGEMNLLTLCYVLFGRRRIVMWNVNPRDFEARSPQDVARRVVEAAAAGSVVLLHDAREDMDTDPQVTVDAVRLMLQGFKSRGLLTSTVSTALAAGMK
jgi:peptidoglycan/xylan/chitin deacetylase (PgdA/CDA1 family)